jgi:hypothetical protein
MKMVTLPALAPAAFTPNSYPYYSFLLQSVNNLLKLMMLGDPQFYPPLTVHSEVQFTLEQAMKTQRKSRGMALLFL